MLWLVEADLATSGENDRGQAAPSHLLHRTALHLLPHQRLHRRPQVVAHEVQFVQVVLFGGMKRSFRGRQCKNKPTVPGIHRRKFENIAKESPIRLGVFAVNDNVSSGNQGSLLTNSQPFCASSGIQSFSNCRAITSRCTSLVPSPIVHSFTSR